MHTLSSRHQS